MIKNNYCLPRVQSLQNVTHDKFKLVRTHRASDRSSHVTFLSQPYVSPAAYLRILASPGWIEPTWLG